MRLLIAFIMTSMVGLAVRGDTGNQALTALKGCLGDLHSVSANFQQQLYASDGYLVQDNSGSMVVAAPGRIRWLVESPMEQWVISDGSTLWLYDPDLEQVIIRPFDQNLAEAPALLLTGDTEQLGGAFLVDFAVVDGEQSKAEDAKGCHFKLTPRDEQSLYRELTLSLNEGLPVGITIVDSLEQRTRISFDNAVLNGEVDANLFTFEPPPGVDVIHDG
ncbi:MAG TPA: outer membrane lipoprotein carrier protein LolA [Porticoccaceae bacterium]|nr:outer membrane lipoprotein carrier protein LolA [Porticoccaceae bacterium]